MKRHLITVSRISPLVNSLYSIALLLRCIPPTSPLTSSPPSIPFFIYILTPPHISPLPPPFFFFFFLNDRAPPEISPFPLHAPLPILVPPLRRCPPMMRNDQLVLVQEHVANRDRLIQQAARVPAHVQDQAIQRGRIQLLQCIRDLEIGRAHV